MNKASFGQLAEKLEKAIIWLEVNGIRIENSRIKAYHSAIKAQLSRVIEEESKETHEEFMATAFEANMLVEVFDHFPRSELKVLRDKISKVLAGPLLPQNEIDHRKKGEARNFQYELLLASSLSKYGLEVGFSKGDKEDLHFFYESDKIFVECKRPFSEKGLPDAIREATNQLKSRLTPGYTKEKGLLAISIDKIDKTKNEPIEFGSYEEAEKHLNQQTLAIFTKQMRLITRKMEKKIPGAICSLYTPIRIKENVADLYSLSLNAFVPFDYETGKNYAFMAELSGKMSDASGD